MLPGLYKQLILDNAVNPVGHGKAIEATHRCALDNPLCGDSIEVLLRIEDDAITDAAFEGEACAICLASCSLMMANLPGQDKSSVSSGYQGFSKALEQDRQELCPDYMLPMLEVKQYPARIRCAVLPWEAAAKAVAPNSNRQEP